MSTKVEAKRFSGKPGQWPHYELSLRAHFAINDLAKHFNGDLPDAAEARAEYVKAQQKIYAYILLTCDDRAATTLLAVPIADDKSGWLAYTALKDKYGGARDQQLSGLIKELVNYRQKPDQSSSDYLNEMRAKLTRIESVAAGNKDKI